MRFSASLICDRDHAVLLFHLKRAPALDFEPLGFLPAQDILGIDRQLMFDPRPVDGFLGADLRLFGLAFPLRLLQRDFGALLGAPHRNLALLLEAGIFGFFFDRQSLLFRLQVLGADRDLGILLDVVSLLLARLDLFGQPRHAFRVERVGRIEHIDVGLIEIGERHRLELQAVGGERVGHQRFDAADIVAAIFVNLLHGHRRRDGAHRVDETGPARDP